MPIKRPRVSLTLKDSSSSDPENSGSSDTGTKRHKTMRRQNACGPCRISKTKCDGAEPCGACRSERRKSKTCEYSTTSGRRGSQTQQAELLVSPSGSFNSTASHTMLETEQCERNMPQKSNQSQIVDQLPKPSELNMHKVLLLRRVVDEFIDVGPKKGRASNQIKDIQRLWSSFIKSGMTDGPSAGISHASTSDNDGNCRDTNGPTSQLPSEHITPQEKLRMWQAHLDATVQLVNAGKLMQAWNSVAMIMREIESFDIEHEQVLRRSKAMSESTTLICLKLIDLECALSFFVGGGSHLNSWTQGRFLSSRIEQRKTDDHLFAVKTSLYSEIQVILQTDVSQKEGLWKFLRIVNEMKHPAPPTDLIKVSLTTKQDDTAGMQELLLISHLCLAILRCRTAVVSGHYAEQGLPAPSDSPSDIVRQLQLCSSKKKGTESGEVVMHARAVLQAFESLCKIDPEGTAQNWFRLCGALIAAILVAVAKLRGQTKDEEADKTLFGRIEACFEELKTRNQSSPIYDKALEILQQFGQQNDPAREVASVKMETKTPTKRHSSDSIPAQRCAEFQITSLTDVKAEYVPVAPSSTGIVKVNGSDTPSRRKRRKVAKAEKIQLDMIPPLQSQVKFGSDHGESRFTNTHINSEQVMGSRPLIRPDMEVSGSYNSSGRTISEHSTFDDPSANECELYHLGISEMSRPPHAIWAHAPRLPNGNEWYWCQTLCQQCPFRQMDGSVTAMNTMPLMGQGHLDSQFNMTQQPYATIRPTESFGSCSTMTIDNTTAIATSHALNASTMFQTGTNDVGLDRARVLDLEVAVPPSETPLQARREYDTTMDVTIKGSDGWNEMQVETLQCNGQFPYDNEPKWYPATLTQQGGLTHAYEQQYGPAESAGAMTPGFDPCASLGGSWRYRSDNEWSSAESSFRGEADASNLRQ